MSVPRRGTVSVLWLWKVTVVAACAFAVGFVCMSVVNSLAHGLAAAAGAHPSGRGALRGQVAGGALFAVVAGIVAALWTRRDNAALDGRRVHLLVVIGVLLACVLTPIAVVAWRKSEASAAERERSVSSLRTATDGWEASNFLSWTPEGREALHDVFASDAPERVRVIAGIRLAEAEDLSPAELADMTARLQKSGSDRRTLLDGYGRGGRHYQGSKTIERWIVAALEDPAPDVRAEAIGALIGNSVSGPEAPQACPALRRLTREADPAWRAKGMLLVSACRGSAIRDVLADGTRDADATVRLAVLRRLAWRMNGEVDDTAADVGDRVTLANALRDDRDSAVRAAASERLEALGRIMNAIR